MELWKTFQYYHVKWNIFNFLISPQEFGKPFYSPEFITHFREPVRWRLAVIGRDKEGSCCRTTICLQRSQDCAGPVEVPVKLKVSIIDRRRTVRWTETRDMCFKTNVMFSFKKECMEFDAIVDSYGPVLSSHSILMICCEMLFEHAQYVDMSEVDLDLKTLSNDFRAFREAKIVSDFSLKHKDENIPLHKAFLKARSPYISRTLNREAIDDDDDDHSSRYDWTDDDDGDYECDRADNLTVLGRNLLLKKMISYWYSGDLRELLSKPTFDTCSFISTVEQNEIKRFFTPQTVDLHTTWGAHSCTIKWTIDNYSKFENFEYLDSPVFHQVLPKETISWRFVLYPKGTKEAPDYVSLYAITSKEELKFPVHLEVIVLGKIDEFYSYHSTLSWLNPPTHFGFRYLIKLSEIQDCRDEVIIEDTLTIRFRLKVGTGDVTQYVHEISNSACSSLESFNILKYLAVDLKKLFEDKDSCDATLVVCGEKYRVHKSVLCARSPFFTDIFKDCKVENVEFPIFAPDLDADTFEKVLKYIYYAEAIELNAETAMKLYPISQKCKISRLKDLSSTFFVNNLTVDNVLHLIEVAHMFGDIEVKHAAIRFISDKWTDISDTDSWEKFKKKNEELVSDILSYKESPSKIKKRKIG